MTQIWPHEFNELTLAVRLLDVQQAIDTAGKASDGDETWKQRHVQEFVGRLERASAKTIGGDFARFCGEFSRAVASWPSVDDGLMKEAEQAAHGLIQSRLEPAPLLKADYDRRIHKIERISYVGSWARSIPRGWVPIIEKVLLLLQEAHLDEDRGGWKTDQIKEKMGSLRWYVSGSDAFREAARLAESISEHCCYVCGQQATWDLSDEYFILTLCEDHKKQRKLDPDSVHFNEPMN